MKGYVLLSAVKNMGKYLSGEYREKIIDRAKSSATDRVKVTSTIIIPKTAEATDDLIRNKDANKTTQTLPQNNSENSINIAKITFRSLQ